MKAEADIQSPIDFRRMSGARPWMEASMVRLSWRRQVFDRIGQEHRLVLYRAET